MAALRHGAAEQAQWHTASLAMSSTLDIGGVHLLPLSNPIRLAESLVTLDNTSSGPFLFCPALGWAPREFDALGVPIGQRVGRFRETLDIMQRLWYSDEPFDFEGKYFSFQGLRMTARPERPGGIPIWVGASSASGVRRAAALVRLLATDELAVDRFTEAYNAYYRALGGWGIFREVVGQSHETGVAGSRVPAGRVILGSPLTAIRQLMQYMRLGFNEFIFQVGVPGTPEVSVRESLALLGSEVLPQLQQLGGC